MVHDGALQRRHDLLAIVDGQSSFAVKQVLPALVDAYLLSARIANFCPALNHDSPFHRHRFVSDQNDGGGLFEPNKPCPTPEKLPVSISSHSTMRGCWIAMPSKRRSPIHRAELPPNASGTAPECCWANRVMLASVRDGRREKRPQLRQRKSLFRNKSLGHILRRA